MYKDEIIAEVWRNRDAYVKEHQHDLKKIVEDLRQWEEEHPSRWWTADGDANGDDKDEAPQRRIAATDEQIDQLVYELYSLMADEIKIVGEATRRR